MTDFITPTSQLKGRKSAETRFQWYGRGAIFVSLLFLVVMVGSIITKGVGAFGTTNVTIEVDLGPDAVDPANPSDARFEKIVKDALKERFPDATKRADRRMIYGLLSNDMGFELERFITENPSAIGGKATVVFRASDDLDAVAKGAVDRDLAEHERRMSDKELAWIDDLIESGAVERSFNWSFFTNGDSREPELAGILSALTGSALTLLVCFCVSFPVAILAAIYLEEFAPKNRFSDLIEVNINNLAAVPSIVFGLLGLSMFLNTFGMPRSSPLVGGLVLSLMTLPTIIIAARASLRAVPPSIREAALGMGASPVQATFHHVAPLALPGILTGTIVGMAQALGETAPLLMIGMVAFIVDVPDSILEPATALPVQIFLWADAPERAFVEKTSAAIMVLLLFLVTMNIIAILLRRKFEKRF